MGIIGQQTPAQMKAAANYSNELSRDKQDDDWSRWLGFTVNGIEPWLGGTWHWEVLANNAVRVGVYDSFDEACRVKAKLDYRRTEQQHSAIGLDGVV